jgi:hypothetical protein
VPLIFTADDATTAEAVANNLNVFGGANIDTTAAADTIVISLDGTTNHAVQIGNIANNLTSLAIGTDGQVLLGATGADPAFATLTSTGGTIAFTTGVNTLNLETDASIATQYDGDSGSAVPDLGVLEITGGVNITTSAASNDVSMEITDVFGNTPAGGNDGMVIIDSSGELGSQTDLLMPNNPAFLSTISTEISDVTGAGTPYVLVWQSEIFDQDNNFDGVSTFTAPVTGKYFFTLNVRVFNLTLSMTRGIVRIITSNRSYSNSSGNVGAQIDSVFALGMQVSSLVDMDAGDTAQALINILNGGGDTADIAPAYSAGIPGSFFSGYLVS